MTSSKCKMTPPTLKALGLAIATLSSGLASADTISDMQGQMKVLADQVHDLQQKLDSASKPSSTPTATSSNNSSANNSSANNGPINIGPASLTIGGFIEAAGIYRNRNETADMGSKWAPLYPNQDGYHTNESRFSSRQSRLSLLFQGPEMDSGKGEAYYEMDFLGVGTTSNSTESNSYVPRTRHIYMDYTFNNGLQILGGQTWSLVTQNKTGIDLRKENIPMTIDAQYVPGFSWTRNPQFRVTEKFSKYFSAAISLESPQSIVTGKAPTGAVASGSGGSTLNSTNNYSFDSTPDVIGKVALDPGFGHYELLGMQRHFQDRLDPASHPIDGHKNEATAHAWGANTILPVVPKYLDLQASLLTGEGIGRYGSAQLPDWTYNSDGTINPIKERQVLFGLVGHPASFLDVYGYVGMEHSNANYSTVGANYYGYGNPGNSNAGCDAATGTCTANVRDVKQWTVGTTYKFYRNPNGGYMTAGLQFSHTWYDIFRDSAGHGPDSDMNVGMVSLRYYPGAK